MSNMVRKSARDCNRITIRYAESGEGPPVVFLHGFPDFSYSWRHQFPVLTSAGFRCLAPDLRGYNETDKPRHVRDYDIDVLVNDVAAFIERTVGWKGACVVGHDWGGIIAWYLAANMPGRVRKLVILNAPHPAVYRRALKGSQILRSWYVGAFQIPFLPELVLSSFHYRLLTRLPARSEAEAEVYEEAFSQPHALTAALNYYRAAARRMLRRQPWHKLPRITQPTLVLWGEKDTALGPALLHGLEQHVQKLQIIRFTDVGHWLHIDGADRVNQELIRFLK